jgi:hypothetical protein
VAYDNNTVFLSWKNARSRYAIIVVNSIELTQQALKRPITCAVTPADGKFDFTNIDRWYERDAGERVGAYTLYHLKLRE